MRFMGSRTGSPGTPERAHPHLANDQANTAIRVRRVSLRKAAVIAVVAVAGIAFAGCAATSTKTENSTGDVLTIAAHNQPLSINPALSSTGTGALFTTFAYQSLLYHAADGTYKPSLATSFGYVGTGNRVFEMTLRSDVKFSDGSPLTAQGVVDFLRYFQSAKGPFASTLSSLQDISATTPTTVRITLSVANPILPLLLSQDYSSGWVISAEALKNPQSLNTATFGAGPYMLDPSRTVTNDHYTYVANPHYYDKSVRHFREIVVKVMTNPTSVLQAMKTGQVDVAEGDSSTAEAAQRAGLQTLSAKSQVYFLGLYDRNGTKARPLGDVRVRQALNYAVNRQATASALAGANGAPTAQFVQEGVDLYDPSLESAYPYDPAKAKALLAEAGYPNGFTLKVLSTPGITDLLSQAMASDFAKVGVKLDIDSVPAGSYVPSLLSGKWAAVSFHFGGGPAGWYQSQLLLRPNGVLNPFHTSDPEVNTLLDRLGQAELGSSEGRQIAQSVGARVVHDAWFVPVIALNTTLYAAKDVQGIHMSMIGMSDNLIEWRRG